jgi:hypothetical protein
MAATLLIRAFRMELMSAAVLLKGTHLRTFRLAGNLHSQVPPIRPEQALWLEIFKPRLRTAPKTPEELRMPS